MKLCHAFWLFGCIALASCASAIVGAECGAGFTRCADACVDLSADFRNCGACGNDCGVFLCEQSVCSAVLRPETNDASIGDGGAALPPDASFNPNPNLGGCNLGEQECPGGCASTQVDHNNCGECDLHCAADELCSAGECNVACEEPLVLCGGSCVDFETDVTNCGGCGRSCPSGICEVGECIGVVPGFVVTIGHDFVAGAKISTGMRRIAGNAVFLGRGSPVRVLVFKGEASASSVKGVESAIDFVKSESGRDWKKTDAVETVVPAQLRSADVFLIHAQAKARKSTLMKLGKQWGNALAQFVATGGVIVLFEGPSTMNDGTFRILEPASIFSALGRDAIAKQALTMIAPGLGVSARVPSRYLSADNTVRFRSVTTPGTTIVVDSHMDPVVVQRIIVP